MKICHGRAGLGMCSHHKIMDVVEFHRWEQTMEFVVDVSVPFDDGTRDAESHRSLVRPPSILGLPHVGFPISSGFVSVQGFVKHALRPHPSRTHPTLHHEFRHLHSVWRRYTNQACVLLRPQDCVVVFVFSSVHTPHHTTRQCDSCCAHEQVACILYCTCVAPWPIRKWVW